MKYAAILAFSVVLAGCSTVKMPKVNLLDLPEFEEDYENIKDYPKVSDAPPVPTDQRKDQEWDEAARSIMKVRDEFSTPADGEAVESDAAIEARIKELIAKAEAYKLDDPE